MDRAEMRKKVEEVTSLPTLPGSVTRITRMLDDSDITTSEVVNLNGDWRPPYCLSSPSLAHHSDFRGGLRTEAVLVHGLPDLYT